MVGNTYHEPNDAHFGYQEFILLLKHVQYLEIRNVLKYAKALLMPFESV